MEADFVVVGAGSAGCVVANRISARATKVTLIEAGPRDSSIFIRIPVGAPRLIGHPIYDWCFETEIEDGAGRRIFNVPRGRTLGGTSSINAMNFVRGLPSDFEQWTNSGCRGWRYEDVLPAYKDIESFEGGEDTIRGRSGLLAVTEGKEILSITDQFVEAAVQSGFGFVKDINGGVGEAVGYAQMNQRGRFRASAASSFLAPISARPNLKVETDCQAVRLLFEGRKCIGVRVRRGRREYDVLAAKEVILSAGSINSPHLLQISGIGCPDHLSRIGVPVTHCLPNVGRNLQDHYAVPVTARVRDALTMNDLGAPSRLLLEVLRWIFLGRGVLTYTTTSAVLFCRSGGALSSPDLQLLFFPGSFVSEKRLRLEREPGVTILVSLARPRSRGTVLARSSDPSNEPEIRLNYLANKSDQDVLVAGLGIAHQVFRSPALKPHVTEIIAPTKVRLSEYVQTAGTSICHLVGTCRMGEDNDAVVDSDLRVRGITGLRVVDSSIMPTITTGNPNASAIMIGYRGAEMVLRDAGL